jgi:type II secretory pathway pseudopilin PulG
MDQNQIISNRKSAGFSLVELLVGVGLTGVILVAAIQQMNQHTANLAAIKAKTNAQMETERAINLFRKYFNTKMAGIRFDCAAGEVYDENPLNRKISYCVDKNACSQENGTSFRECRLVKINRGGTLSNPSPIAMPTPIPSNLIEKQMVMRTGCVDSTGNAAKYLYRNSVCGLFCAANKRPVVEFISAEANGPYFDFPAGAATAKNTGRVTNRSGIQAMEMCIFKLTNTENIQIIAQAYYRGVGRGDADDKRKIHRVISQFTFPVQATNNPNLEYLPLK